MVATMSLTSGVSFLVCVAALISCAANGLETTTLNTDLVVESVTYLLSPQDSSVLEVTAEFTSTERPDASWTHGDGDGGVVVLDQTMDHSSGRGSVSTWLPVGSSKLLTLNIGHFYAHVLSISLHVVENNTYSKTFNAKMSRVVPGYDITYVPGSDDSFAVTVTVPKHVADGYTWVNFGGKNDVRADACYVDQDTQTIMAPVDNLDDFSLTRDFLTVNKSFTEDEAIVKLSFDTSSKDISGYFEIYSSWADNDSFVTFPDFPNPFPMYTISEKININVHDNTTPGPFPAGYSHLRTSDNRDVEVCRKRSTWKRCLVFCYGYANDIVNAEIFKRDENGSPTIIQDIDYIYYTTNNHVTFDTRLNKTREAAGDYVCRITSQDGTTSEKNVTIQVID